MLMSQEKSKICKYSSQDGMTITFEPVPGRQEDGFVSSPGRGNDTA